MNGAEVIAKILKIEGTEFFSCYPRNQVIEPCAAIDIRPILCRQERVGVGIADGYSRIKRGKKNGVFGAQAGRRLIQRMSLFSFCRGAYRCRANTCARCSAPPTSIALSRSGRRWRTTCRNCPT
jgi:hypothetical protein